VDTLLEQPWKWYIARMTEQRLKTTLANMDVFHASDVGQFVSNKAKIVSTVHDLSPLILPELHTRVNHGFFEKKIHYIQTYPQTLIAVSEHTKQDVVERLDIPAERIHVVYNGVDPHYRPLADCEEIKRVINKYKLPGTGYILHVGTLEPRKNLVRLIKAYAMVQAQFQESLPPLVLAGGKGWLYEDIFKSVAQLGLQQSIIFTGFVADEDLPALFNGALFFVYPSLYEGFGIPVLEAMACGLPVITSNVSALPEITGDAALLIDPLQVDSIAAALQTLLESSTLRTTLQQAGLARARRFSWERAAQETMMIYQKAIEL
jgi:glycosyltransferase involved in cell wall biosynthesis